MAWWKQKIVQTIGLVGLAVIAVYGLIYLDVVARAKESYLEGEKYMEWAAHPEKKKAFYDDQFQSQKKKFDQDLENKKITSDEHAQKIETLQFDTTIALQESSLKYAYQWYKDTYELFSPPESKWVTQAREKAPVALALWKKELDAQKIPYQDYMFE